MTRPTQIASRRCFLRTVVFGSALAVTRHARANGPLIWNYQQQVGPFVIRTMDSYSDDAPLFEELPQLEMELRRVLGLNRCEALVGVHLFASRAQNEAFLASELPHVPYRRALYIERGGEASVYTYRSENLAVDLRHELTHAVLHADLPTLPLWLDEGLAEYFEEAPARRASGHEHLRAVRWNARLGSIATIEQLEQHLDLSAMTALDYRHAWAWVHFLLHGPAEGHALLVRYLSDLRSRRPAGDFAARLEQALPNCRRLMSEHFLRWQPQAN